MAHIMTSRGFMDFRQHIIYDGMKRQDDTIAFENLTILARYLDRSGLNWGPAFGTLIGIVRNDAFLPWAQGLDLYFLKEDEERFKDLLWKLKDEGFDLVKYERRGFYTLQRKGEYSNFFVFRKISPEIRHSGGRDFIHEKYIRKTVKWNFKGIDLNVPEELDEYLTFQYGDWVKPVQTTNFKKNTFERLRSKAWIWMKLNLPNNLYYPLILRYHQADFNKFKTLCKERGCPIPQDVELSYSKPRKGKKVLTVGVYDLIHKGHVELYRRAKGLGDYLIVAVQDGDEILKYKPQAKVMNSTEDRMYMVKSIRYVDEVIVYKGVDDIVKEVDFDIFVTGPDQIHSGFQNAIQWCESHGREHIVLGRTEGVSSSELKAKIAAKTQKRD
jgi:glycerol-3-phosphate cytidylyltransferase